MTSKNIASDSEIKQRLLDVLLWAKGKIRAGGEPPWAWFQYMKLIETVEEIQKSMAATTTMEDSQQSG